MAIIISVGSGKGGVGKSVIAANLALLIAKKGKRVTLVDLDIGGADIHILFGLMNPPLTLTDFLHRRIERLEDIAHTLPAHSGLSLIPGTGDTLATANMPYAKKKRLIRQLKDLQTDVVIVDIGAGTSYHALDFFLMADQHVMVATPDPTSVLDLYRFIKLAAIRRVLSSFLARGAMADALSDHDFCSVDEVLEAAGQTDEASRLVAETTLRAFQPALILNRLSGRAHVNVAALKKLLTEYIGGHLTLLGEIPDDPAMERAVRGYLPVADREPTSPAAVALAAIADTLLTRMTSHTC
ncbi:MAG: MinD/ParA family protein [Nitrospira sp.]|nr:MAG: MinD/ParA family protein [Nitrospira sp.]